MLHFVVEVSAVIVYDFPPAVAGVVFAIAVNGFRIISPLVRVEGCGSGRGTSGGGSASSGADARPRGACEQEAIEVGCSAMIMWRRPLR